MKDGLIIRPANLGDLPSIVNLENECAEDAYSPELIKQSLSDFNTLTLIAVSGEDVLAYVSASVLVDESDMLKIVVKQKFRRMGVGIQLLNELKIELKKRGVDFVFLEVRESNDPAKRLYEKFGFVKISKRQKYYSDGENAEIYRLKIND